MKNKLTQSLGAGLLGLALTLGPLAVAQSSVSSTTSTTTSTGTISEFSPNTVVVRSESSSAPMSYSYSKSTTIVDESGSPVDVSVVKSGVPVQVIYATEGDRMVASKIIVKKGATSTTTTAPAAVEERRETSTTTTTSE